MKMRALFDAEQMDIHDFAKLLRLSSFDSINALQAQGWLSTDADALMIHPLVAQIVRKWPLTKAMRDAAISIMGTLNERLRAEVNAVRKEGMPSGRGDSQALKLGKHFCAVARKQRHYGNAILAAACVLPVRRIFREPKKKISCDMPCR